MKRTIYIILISVFVVLLTTSTFFIMTYYNQRKEATDIYDNLADIVENPNESQNKKFSKFIWCSEKKATLSKYEELHRQNSDLVGWIKIDGTKINYPVMQTPNNPNFYLYKSFDKSNSVYGCPYVQANCDVDKLSDNIIIYGHNMKDGTMFANLELFRDKSFYNKHHTFSFDTLNSKNTYEIFAVFTTTVDESSNRFKYYNFVDAYSEKSFNNYVDKCKKLSFYDTGVNAEYGNKLVTLSTCEYTNKNGRLVVVGKQLTS